MHKFSVGDEEGYVTVGLFEDGFPEELFIVMSKEGSTVWGLMDSFATAVPLALQYGVPLKVLCDKFSHMRVEPSGWAGNPEIGYAKSLMDYLFRLLELRFLKGERRCLFEISVEQSGRREAKKGADETTPKRAPYRPAASIRATARIACRAICWHTATLHVGV